MGYKITLSQGKAEQTYDPDQTIQSDLILSLMVKKGSWFFDKNFGLQELPKKHTAQNRDLVIQYCKQATKWLIDAGKAKSIDFTAEPDPDDRNRANVQVTAVQTNGTVVSFNTFVPVI